MIPTGPPPSGAEQPEPPRSTDDLFAVLYRELHTLAQRHLRNQHPDFALGTTTLLHEAYLNLANRPDIHFPDRARFLGYASRAMRGLIVDYARLSGTAKRGGEFQLLSLQTGAGPAADDGQSLAELSDALDELATVDQGLAELVDLHFFCGLSFVEIAALRGVSDRTIQREWQKARLTLHRTLDASTPEDGAHR